MCSDLATPSASEQLIQPDWMLRASLSLLGVFLLIYLAAPFPPALMQAIEYYWAEIALISLTVVLFLTAALRAIDTSARNFWMLMTAAFCCWWLADVAGLLIRSDSPWLRDFIKDLLFLTENCLVVIAADLRLGVLKSATQRLQARMTAISSIAVIAGVFGYVALVPALTGINQYESAFLVHAALDAYIALRFLIQGSRTPSRSWQALLLLIGCGFALIAVADLLVVAFDSGMLQYRPGQPLNLVWFLFYIPLFLASRVNLRSPQVSARHRITLFASTLNPGPMMAYGVALPLIHLGGYGFGLFDDDSRTVRDLFVLIWVLGASAALIWQYVLLRAQLRLAEAAQVAAREEAAELERQLRRGQRIELVGQLSGGLAHEFGNSLFGAESLAQKILRDVRRPGSAVQETSATGLINALAGSRELIRKFRSLGRGDDTESSVVNVVDEVKSTLELLRSGISQDVSIEFSAERDDIFAIARKQDLQQITLNLVLNARDAAGEPGHIAVELRQGTTAARECASCGKMVSGNQVSLLVTDNGSGIDPRVRQRLFEPLVTSKPEGKGSGLGLSIVHSLVHQLRGHITLDELPQGGCRFTVMLPAVQIDVGSSHLPDPALNSRLLVVENDDRIAAVFRESGPLQQLRPNHVSSYDAAQIFIQQDEHRPALIVVGNLPDVLDAAAIVANAREHGIHVIMCARRSQRAMLASLQGVDVLLEQPVDIDLFSSALLKYLTAVS